MQRMGLLSFLRRRDNDAREAAPSDFFDVFHRKTMDAIVDSRRLPLSQWSVADAESSTSAARFVLGLLRERAELRRRFPRALSVESGYRNYLRDTAATEFGLSADALAKIDALFVSQPG